MMLVSELSELLGADRVVPRGVSTRAAVSADLTKITSVEHDSRRVMPGSLFACISGLTVDGHDFASEAVASGASALLTERVIDSEVPLLVVDSVRRAVGHAAAAVNGHPAEHLQMVGVTGTDGKTTTVRLLTAMLQTIGRRSLEIGTLTGGLTTPEATELQQILSNAVSEGVEIVAMEVSSHALVQQRLNGCRLRVAAFTNLSPDHLDYHGSMEEYFEAKSQLFKDALAERAVIDVTSVWGRRMADIAARQMPVVEVDQDAVEVISEDARSSVFHWRTHEVELPLVGAFNRANAVVAAEIAVALGARPSDVASALARAVPVAGRFEPIEVGQDFTALVDYAHTPAALATALKAARRFTKGRIILVFGAGGDRYTGKRPMLGAVAEETADYVIVTSDNPRTENPEQIIAQIVRGMRRPPARQVVDRRLALQHAVATACPGDTLLVAGKGHEPEQTIGEQVYAFDDRVVVREEIRRRLRASDLPGPGVDEPASVVNNPGSGVRR